MFSWNDYCQYEYTVKTYTGRLVNYVTYTEEGLSEAVARWGDQIVSVSKVYLGKKENNYDRCRE
jgi:hypothetical protein